MKIRYATLDDIPACVETGRRFHAMTRFAAYDYDAERVARNLRALIELGANATRPHCFFIVEDSDGQPAGILIGCIESHTFSAQPVASVIHYVVLPEKRMSGAGLRLLMAFRKWAENRRAFELNVGVSSGVHIEKMDRFMKRLGFRQTGGNYAMRLGQTG